MPRAGSGAAQTNGAISRWIVAVMMAKISVAGMPTRIIRPMSIWPTENVVAAAAPAQGSASPRHTFAMRIAIDAGLKSALTEAGMKMLQ